MSARRAAAPPELSDLGELIRQLVRTEVAAALAGVTIEARAEAKAKADDYLTARKAAEYAAIAQGTLRRWIREGRLEAKRAGRYYRVRRADLDRVLGGGLGGGPAPSTRLSPEDAADRDLAQLAGRRVV